jgi:hypothetical protein
MRRHGGRHWVYSLHQTDTRIGHFFMDNNTTQELSDERGR